MDKLSTLATKCYDPTCDLDRANDIVDYLNSVILRIVAMYPDCKMSLKGMRRDANDLLITMTDIHEKVKELHANANDEYQKKGEELEIVLNKLGNTSFSQKTHEAVAKKLASTDNDNAKPAAKQASTPQPLNTPTIGKLNLFGQVLSSTNQKVGQVLLNATSKITTNLNNTTSKHISTTPLVNTARTTSSGIKTVKVTIPLKPSSTSTASFSMSPIPPSSGPTPIPPTPSMGSSPEVHPTTSAPITAAAGGSGGGGGDSSDNDSNDKKDRK